MESACAHFLQCLKHDPDHAKARTQHRLVKTLQVWAWSSLKRPRTVGSYLAMRDTQKEKEAGNEAFKAGQWQEALRLYSLALERDPKNKDMNSKLYNNRATVLQKVGYSQGCLACRSLSRTCLSLILI